jgi:hypothetical protein
MHGMRRGGRVDLPFEHRGGHRLGAARRPRPSSLFVQMTWRSQRSLRIAGALGLLNHLNESMRPTEAAGRS